MDEALQRLYWACRTNSDFPGKVPDESTGVVTTEAILKGLDLEPTIENPDRPPGLRQQPPPSYNGSSNNSQHPATISLDDADSSGSQTPVTTPPLLYGWQSSFTTTSVPLTASHIQMHDSYTTRPVPGALPPQRPTGRRSSMPMQIRPNSTLASAAGLSSVEVPLDVHAFLDESPCTFPAEMRLLSSSREVFPGDLLPIDQMALMSPPRDIPPMPATGTDAFLYPWPGTLAAAYQSRAAA